MLIEKVFLKKSLKQKKLWSFDLEMLLTVR